MRSSGCRRRRPAWFIGGTGLVALCLCAAGAVSAQTHLLGVNGATEVQSIRFAFEDEPDIDVAALKELIATEAPSFRDRLPWPFRGPRVTYAFDPVELQRDVVRLRSHLQAMGFLHASVNYAASSFSAERNTIRVVFTITQGPPIVIQDVGFYTANGYLASALEGDLRARWIAFRDRTSFQTGDRYTSYRVVQIEDDVLSWLKDEGHAFATLYTVATIDSVYNTADIDFLVDPGPPGTITEVHVNGHRRVSPNLVRRELPFKVGDTFSHQELLDGQRALFALNLFQVAQVQLPPQPRDSSVAVQVDLREARLRYIASEVGYNSLDGLWGKGRWSHRNFLGGARTLAATAELRTGILATSSRASYRLARASVALTQPYLFVRGLAVVLEPYAKFERDPLLLETTHLRGVNRQEYGVNATALYGIVASNSVSLRYSLARAIAYADALTGEARDAYGKGVLTLGGTLERSDGFLSPRRGFRVQAFVEQAGGIERRLGLQVGALRYFKLSAEASGFIPLTQDLFIGLRVAGGRIWPGHAREVTLYSGGEPQSIAAQFASPLENRFDPVRFYLGGEFVRGWSPGYVGPKVNRTAFVTNEAGQIVMDGNLPRTTAERFEPVGGLARAALGVEFWYRLGGPWRASLFLDAGQVSATRAVDPSCAPPYYRDRAGTQPVDVQCGFADTGRLHWDKIYLGTGAGLRYETPIGFIRLDVATKVNPDPLDLQTPRNAFLARQGYIKEKRSRFGRFGLHVSIGQAF